MAQTETEIREEQSAPALSVHAVGMKQSAYALALAGILFAAGNPVTHEQLAKNI